MSESRLGTEVDQRSCNIGSRNEFCQEDNGWSNLTRTYNQIINQSEFFTTNCQGTFITSLINNKTSLIPLLVWPSRGEREKEEKIFWITKQVYRMSWRRRAERKWINSRNITSKKSQKLLKMKILPSTETVQNIAACFANGNRVWFVSCYNRIRLIYKLDRRY